MMTFVEIDRESRKKMDSVISQFVKLSGQSVEDAVQMIAVSASKRLARNVQRFGLTAKGGKSFEQSIGAQVVRAIQHANANGIPGTAEQVHLKLRRKGSVPKNLPTGGQYKREPIPIPEREALAAKKKALAGQAKGAWIQAGNEANGKAITRIPKWVDRHNNSGYGRANKSGKGMKHTIILENKVPYLRFIQPEKMIADATVYGMKSGYKRLQTIIDALTEKANRELV